MPTDALDTAAVAAAPETYRERRQACGCSGVPDGQHVGFCAFVRRIKSERVNVRYAPICEACHYRAATDRGACGICGTPR